MARKKAKSARKATRRGATRPVPEGWPAQAIEMRAVADLVPYARNARTHSAKQVAKIAASIKEWGWTNPILIDEGGVSSRATGGSWPRNC